MQTRPPSVTLIVAATLSNGIGSTGRLPWRLSKEMAYFAKVTTYVSTASSQDMSLRNCVIMGRKTWESIPLRFRPLKDRINIIVSSSYPSSEYVSFFIYTLAPTPSRTEDTVVKTNSIDGACTYTPSPPSFHIDRRFLIGGAQLYRHALTSSQKQYTLDRILLTRILEPEFPECDVFLPEFRSEAQIAEENAVSPAETTEMEGSSRWRRAAHEELSSWVGFDVPSGVQEEKGIKYQFQMWVRDVN